MPKGNQKETYSTNSNFKRRLSGPRVDPVVELDVDALLRKQGASQKAIQGLAQMDIAQLVQQVALPNCHRELVCQFLLVFSRFEAALKRAGFARQNGERLTVEWRRFARESGQGIDLPVEDLGVLVLAPPARQQIMDNQLSFVPEDRPAELTAEWVLEMVYRVRNNLFHGGKWPADPERDGALLQSCLVALAFFVDLDQRVRHAYLAP
jgi:hypothetical protein